MGLVDGFGAPKIRDIMRRQGKMAVLCGVSICVAIGGLVEPAKAMVPDQTGTLAASVQQSRMLRAQPWTIQSDRLSCQLSQVYGAGDQTITLHLNQSVVMGHANWSVVGKPMGDAPADLMLRVTKRPASQKGKIFTAKAAWTDWYGTAEWRWDDEAIPPNLDGIDALEIEAAHLPPFVLDRGKLAQGSAELAKCALRQRGALGWNEAVVQKPKPVINPGQWTTNDDYPSQALYNGAEGTASFLLMIADDGSVTDCHIVGTSHNDDLDTATCALTMERAKFHPAKNAKGEAVRSQYYNRIRWQIPD